MARPTTSVVKIGGSLLSASNLPQRLMSWLAGEQAAQPEAHFVLVVGGGRLVDVVRELDANVHLGDAAAHRIAIELMDVTADIVAAMLPQLNLTADFGELQERQSEQPGVTLFRPGRFMAEIEPKQPGVRLSVSWEVTSDSIAARLAIVLAADELVLLKSGPPPDGIPYDALSLLAEASYVDTFLPRLVPKIPRIRLAVP